MKLIFTSLALLVVLGTQAQIDSVLFGITTSTGGPTISPVTNVNLIRANTFSGQMTNATNTATFQGMGVQIGNSTIDVYNEVFYFMNGTGHLIGLDLNNGSVVSNQSLTMASPGNLFNMYFNCGDTTVYALQNLGSAGVFLAKVDPATGLVTTVSSNALSSSLQINNVTIDPYNQIYYYFTMNSIIGVSLSSGSIVSSASMSVPSSTVNYNFSGIFYNNADSILYGLALNPNLPGVYLAKFAPTGTVALISQNSVASSIVVANSAVDPYNKIYYFINGNQQLMGVSMLTGSIISSPTLTNSTGNNLMYEMNFNCSICPKPKQPSLTGTFEQRFSEQVSVFPNPAAESVFIKFAVAGEYLIELYDTSGRLVMHQNLSGQTKDWKLEVSALQEGMYALLVYSGGAKMLHKKLCLGH